MVLRPFLSVIRVLNKPAIRVDDWAFSPHSQPQAWLRVLEIVDRGHGAGVRVCLGGAQTVAAGRFFLASGAADRSPPFARSGAGLEYREGQSCA
jgi:hypothetical protein